MSYYIAYFLSLHTVTSNSTGFHRNLILAMLFQTKTTKGVIKVEYLNVKRNIIDVEHYWIVVRDRESGRILNGSLIEDKKKSIEEIVKSFEKKNGTYMILDIGSGKDSRPEELTELPYI